MVEHKLNKKNNFIAGFYSDKLDLCDTIVEKFHQNEYKVKGQIIQNNNIVVDKKHKDCDEVSFNSVEHTINDQYFNDILSPCMEQYKLKYPYSFHYFSLYGIKTAPIIQHYLPGGGFHAWHTERMSKNVITRHLVFMTYLNDVTDKGETEFFHQKLKVKPEKGLTLIWPVDWTFTHRGIASPSQDKYIITGWYDSVD